MKRELDHLAKFFHMAVDYKKKIGFGGAFLIEPKPHEPTSHQYDFDCANSLAFLRGHGLEKEFQFNVETNHATLAKHTMAHELVYASMNGMLGSIDANRGDYLLGWDTDQFPTDLYLTSQVMYVVLNQGGLGSGGLNFDAKVRRESFEPADLFHAHIGGMDAFAHGLKIAAAMRKDGTLRDFIQQRYSSWDGGIGADIESGKADFASLEAYMLKKGEPAPNASGRQEYLENVLNRYLK
jgi:xylose isomerase